MKPYVNGTILRRGNENLIRLLVSINYQQAAIAFMAAEEYQLADQIERACAV